MKHPLAWVLVLSCACFLSANPARGQTVGHMVAAGDGHSLALTAPSSSSSPATDWTIIGWGRNSSDQCNVPAPNSDFVALAAGGFQSLGLKSDGTIAAWGYNFSQVPAPNANFIAIAAGFMHSLALRSDETVVAWGDNSSGQCDVPAPNADFTAVAGSYSHSLGLKTNGTVVGWGNNFSGQCNVPAPNADFVAVAAGWNHSLGLKSDGTVVAWGYNGYGECNVPAPNAGFVAIVGGAHHSLGLKGDGTIVAWGNNFYGQCNMPIPNADFVAIAAGSYHNLGLKSDGTIVAWGLNDYGQCNVPPPQPPSSTPVCPENQFFGGGGYYDAATGTLDVSVSGDCINSAEAHITDDFTIKNLPMGMPITFTGHMDWVVDDSNAGACGFVGYESPTFPIEVVVGEPFQLHFSAYASAGNQCGGGCDAGYGDLRWASVQGHLWFSDLPVGAVVTSCQGYFQGGITAVRETQSVSAPLAIKRLSPNPASGPFDATIALPSDSPAKLEIFDVKGRLVTIVPVKDTGRGEHRIGIRTSVALPSGIYFVRLSQGAQRTWAKQAIVH